MKPLAVDLYCGLGGWTEGLLAEGYDVIGFDIERHQYGDAKYPAQLVLQDVLTIHGKQFKDAVLIVASPPCQAYSYRAMPWKRAKALPPPDNSLFEACFRIQREACEAAGHHIPLVVENVRGAQKYVGRSRCNFGSFHLWGDVPALMPSPMKRGATKNTGIKNPDCEDWGRFAKTGEKSKGFNVTAAQRYREEQGTKVASESGRRTDIGKGARVTSRDCGAEGVKQAGDWFSDSTPSSLRSFSSKSDSRKAASAMIAKIPLTLSRYIASTYFPREDL